MSEPRAFEVILDDRFESKPPLAERTSVARRPSSTTMLRITTKHPRFDHSIHCNIWRWCTHEEPRVSVHMSWNFGLIQYVNRMIRNRLPRVMKHCSPSGRRNHGRHLKRLLDTWEWNGSTSGPTAWQIYDDYDDAFGLAFQQGNHTMISLCMRIFCHPVHHVTDVI